MINPDLPMFASLVLTPLLFLLMPIRKAMVTAYCFLWMFLPVAGIKMPVLPELDKPATIGVGALIAIVLFYLDLVIKKYSFRWFDIPVVIFGVVIPFFSAMWNGLGLEAVSYEGVNTLFLWVVPYFIGRIILGDEMGVETLAMGIFYGALIYTPLAWFEMFMSPKLHLMFYGWHQHEFLQTRRGWSYRPMVFMQHGLMTSMWLVAGAVCGAWMLYHKRLKWAWPVPAKAAVGFLIFTAALSNSMGALVLMIAAFFVLMLSRKLPPAWVLAPIIAVMPIYIAARATGVVERGDLVAMVEPISSARAASLNFRLYSEDAYVEKALQKPIIGWGGYGLHRPIDPETDKLLVSDGLWIIVFGKNGLIGLVSMTLALIVVPTVVLLSQSARVWRHPRFAASAALMVLLCIYSIDNLFNAMVNPIYMLVAGALASFATQPLADRFGLRRRRPRPVQAEQPYDQPVGAMS